MGGTISPNTAAPTVEGVVPKQRTRDDGKNDVKENNFFDVVFVKPDDPLLSEGAPYPPEPPTSFRPEHKWFSDGARIEAAFRKYFHRADLEQVVEAAVFSSSTGTGGTRTVGSPLRASSLRQPHRQHCARYFS